MYFSTSKFKYRYFIYSFLFYSFINVILWFIKILNNSWQGNNTTIHNRTWIFSNLKPSDIFRKFQFQLSTHGSCADYKAKFSQKKIAEPYWVFSMNLYSPNNFLTYIIQSEKSKNIGFVWMQLLLLNNYSLKP